MRTSFSTISSRAASIDLITLHTILQVKIGTYDTITKNASSDFKFQKILRVQTHQIFAQKNCCQKEVTFIKTLGTTFYLKDLMGHCLQKNGNKDRQLPVTSNQEEIVESLTKR